jgi:UDPglucose 6-dehydrogenase
MIISIVGSGYVGLVTGTCLADCGHTVYCIDINKQKIDNLNKGIIPIYEPGLDALIEKNISLNKLYFTTDYDVISKSDVTFIAVGTPPGEDGSADLQYVLAVAEQFGKQIVKKSVICTKSTVPVGTADKVRNTILNVLKERNENIEFEVVSNPEFLKEGTAIEDFMNPDRIVIGCDNSYSQDIMKLVYEKYTDKIIFTSIKSAEMIKYASNSMLATRIAFMNELSNLCDKVGANIEDVAKGMGTDTRIGPKFLNAGCGYGGSCFPKDVKALIQTGKENNVDLSILHHVDMSNTWQKHILLDKFQDHFKSYYKEDLKVAVWGLSFKPNTDDTREATSLVMLQWLKDNVSHINVYDPIVKELPIKSDNISICNDKYEALDGVECLFIVTEWDEFKNPNFNMIKEYMNGDTIIDGRNIYSLKELENKGFNYISIGRPSIYK